MELGTPETIIEHQALVTADRSSWERQIQCSAGVPEVKLGAEVWVSIAVGFAKMLAAVVSWEIFRRCGCRKVKLQKSALVQTEDMGIVPMPLPDGVPNRPQILASLWEAGYRIHAESYPTEIQEEFFGLIGRRLKQLSEASSGS